jgi:hypothetical protein
MFFDLSQRDSIHAEHSRRAGLNLQEKSCATDLKISRRGNCVPLFTDYALTEVIRAENFTTPIFQYAKMENVACIWNFVV